jgi:hypothetical protein
LAVRVERENERIEFLSPQADITSSRQTDRPREKIYREVMA